MVHSFDASFWAVCLPAFYGMFRKSHLVPTSAANFDFRKQFTCRDVPFFRWGHCSKSTGAKQSNSGKGLSRLPLPFTPRSSLCPCVALANGFSFTSHKAKPNSHAFSWLDHQTLLIQCFTYRAFIHQPSKFMDF